MRHFDIVKGRLKETEQVELQHAIQTVFSVAAKIGVSRGQMVSWILDKYEISSVFIPLISDGHERTDGRVSMSPNFGV